MTDDRTEAAKKAAALDLEWEEDDNTDEGPVDYEVSAVGQPTLSWRDES